MDDAQQTPGSQSNTCCDSWVYMNNAPILHGGEPTPTLPANLIGTLSGVVWYGKWDDPDTAIDSGIFVNQQLLLQEGVSLVNGLLVTSMPASDRSMDVSRSGDFLIVELGLENGESGAYLFDVIAEIGDQYCGPAVVNSSGASGVLEATGTRVPADNDVTLQASDLPSNSFGFFIVSDSQAFTTNPGGSQGHLCLGGMIGRYVGPGQIQHSGSNGEFGLVIDLTQTPQPTGFVSVQTGETWNFQAWYRDAIGGSATSNFTNGLEISFL